ncbi:MAG: OmpA family protein [Myxococcota bacterium]|nr:OmpA family protein [Myxococcota bacterium]
MNPQDLERIAAQGTDPSVEISIVGHASVEGSDEYNESLGERRAHAVAQLLRGLGVTVEPSVSSMGESEAGQAEEYRNEDWRKAVVTIRNNNV